MSVFTGARAALTRAAVPMRLGIASNRNRTPIGPNNRQTINTRVVMVTGSSPVANPVLRCPWWYVTSSNVETGMGNGGTITASIEYPIGSGTFYQALSGGNPALVVPDRSNMSFDPIPGLTIPANTAFALHTHVLAPASTGNVPTNCNLAGRWGDGLESSTGTLPDKTMTGGELTAPASAPLSGYAPIVLGTVTVSARDAIMIGDSILAGVAERNDLSTGGDAQGNIGAFERLLGANGFAFLNMGRDATSAQNWATAGATALRQDLIRDVVARIGINELGANDSATSVPTWSGYMATINTRFLSYAGKMLVVTNSPHTTGLPITSLTSSGTKATATVASTASLASGQAYTMYGQAPAGYAVTAVVTVVSATQFTFPVASGLASPAQPSVVAGDGWATPANQKPPVTAYPANFNTLIRARALAGQSDYLEYNYQLSDYQGSGGEGIWRSPGSTVNPSPGPLTPDGLHTTTAGAPVGAGMSAAPLFQAGARCACSDQLSNYQGSGGKNIWRSAGSTVNPSSGPLEPDGTHTVVLGAQAGAGMSGAPLQ